MPTFEEYRSALKARDTIQALITSGLEQNRPGYRYATVTSINRETRQATVQFPEGGDLLLLR